jgi:hypothetical protein
MLRARTFAGLPCVAAVFAVTVFAVTVFGCAAMTSSASARAPRPAAGSGEHHVITAGSFVRLSGRGPVGVGSTPSTYRWRIVKQPARARARSRATLEQPTNRDPGFVARVPGTYRVRSTVTAADGRSSVYDLGTGVNIAKDWLCEGGMFYDKYPATRNSLAQGRSRRAVRRWCSGVTNRASSRASGRRTARR